MEGLIAHAQGEKLRNPRLQCSQHMAKLNNQAAGSGKTELPKQLSASSHFHRASKSSGPSHCVMDQGSLAL